MKTEVLLRLDQDLFEAVTNGTPTGLSRNSFINDLLLEAFEQQNRSEDVRKALQRPAHHRSGAARPPGRHRAGRRHRGHARGHRCAVRPE